MIDRATLDALRIPPDGESLVVSLFLGVPRQPDEMRSIPARVKNMVKPLRERIDSGQYGAAGRAVRADLDQAADLLTGHRGDLGRGVAVFVSSGLGLKELFDLPAGVRDRAIIDTTAYISPLEAMIDQASQYAAVVLDRVVASIYRFEMGRLESWEVMAAEERGKDNYGGFSGYEEKGAQGRADESFNRLLKSVAGRLGALRRIHGYDYLVLGGHQKSIEALRGVLHAELQHLVAGAFIIDPRTMTTDEVRRRCEEIVTEHQRKVDLDAVHHVVETAAEGGPAVVGIEAALNAINQRAASRILVSVDETVPGSRCGACGWLALPSETCPSCGSEMAPVQDVIDAATSAARAEGGEVRYVLSDTELASPQLGALTRFPVRPIG